jgi:NADH-quinone oxidoreductase subunit A
MSLWPLALYALLVVILAAAMLLLSHVLGETHREHATELPYEGGMIPTGDARGQMTIQFYLVAMLFLIFDIEVVFLLTWAVAARELGLAGFAGAAIFIGVLLVALYYEHRQGALDWGTTARLAELARARSRTPSNARQELHV